MDEIFSVVITIPQELKYLSPTEKGARSILDALGLEEYPLLFFRGGRSDGKGYIIFGARDEADLGWLILKLGHLIIGVQHKGEDFYDKELNEAFYAR